MQTLHDPNPQAVDRASKEVERHLLACKAARGVTVYFRRAWRCDRAHRPWVKPFYRSVRCAGVWLVAVWVPACLL